MVNDGSRLDLLGRHSIHRAVGEWADHGDLRRGSHVGADPG